MFNYRLVFQFLGLLLLIEGICMWLCIPVSMFFHDHGFLPLGISGIISVCTGGTTLFVFRKATKSMSARDGFLIVAIGWIMFSLFGCLPFILSGEIPSFTDAYFETISGFTTTGASILNQVEILPHGLLFWRSLTQWLGGMGIIVMSLAILPLLGVGGMQLYRAETPGPLKDNKLTPRITETAKALWYIYVTLTIICAVCYWLAGMSFFDAVGHSFSTVAIGGFSTHDESIGFFQSTSIEMIAVVFMLLAGMNFALHFIAWKSLNLKAYLHDSELKTYLTVLVLVTAIIVPYLYYTDTFIFLDNAFYAGLFQAVSIGTTTGFTTANYVDWPGFLPVMLLFVSFIGGCAGSTGGGMKVIRFLLLLKQGHRETMRLIRPNAQIPVKVGGKPMPDRVISAVWGFFAAYVGSFVVLMLFLMATGLDQVTAFSAVAACMNNLGPGLGAVGENFIGLTDPAKWALSFAMMLGRLEIFTLLILFTRAFWRR